MIVDSLKVISDCSIQCVDKFILFDPLKNSEQLLAAIIFTL